MHQKMCISTVWINTNFGVLLHAEIHRLMWIPTWGKVYFRGRGFAQFFKSELQHVEIHKIMCKSAPAEIRFSACGNSHEIVHFGGFSARGNTPKIVDFPTCGNTHFCGVFPHAEIRKWISAYFASGFVNFRAVGKNVRQYTFFSGISTCGNTRGSANSRMRKYTRIGVIPHAVIHLIRFKKIVLLRVRDRGERDSV